MLILLESWNYTLEAFFWLLIGAILVISMTILLARPSKSEIIEKEYEDIGVFEENGRNNFSSPIKNDLEEHDELTENKYEKIDPTIEEIKKKWALSFAVFGLIFIMMGGIVLWLLPYDFTLFLGSSMIYVGIMSLIKGISFQIPDEKIIVKVITPLLIFIINFVLLDIFLDIIGNYAWMIQTSGRKIGNIFLVYGLPYILWTIVPSFTKEEEKKKIRINIRLKYISQLSVMFTIFTFMMYLLTDIVLHYPVLRQYSKVGFSLSLYIVGLCLTLYYIARIMHYYNLTSRRREQIKEKSLKPSFDENEV